MKYVPRVVVITATDVVPEGELFARLEAAADLPREARAAVAVQLRDPQLTGRDLWTLGRRLRDVTARLGMMLVVNDRIDLAVALGADGIHLGHSSVSPPDARSLAGRAAWICVACHSASEVVAAARAGADAVTLSSIYASPGKGAPLGTGALRGARKRLVAAGLDLHLIALGGIDRSARVAECLEAGAGAVAAIRADLLGSAWAVFAGETGPR